MSNTADYSDKDILDVIHMMKAARFGNLSIDVQDGRVVKVDVIVKTRSPTELRRISLAPYRHTLNPRGGTA